MFIQVGNDGSRTRMITLFVLVFIVFFVIPYFRDKSNEALPVVVDPQIQSASELTYITLFPLKDSNKETFSLLIKDSKLIVIQGSMEQSAARLIHDMGSRNHRVTVEGESWYYMGYLEGYSSSEFIQKYFSWLIQYKAKVYRYFGVEKSPIERIFKWIDEQIQQKSFPQDVKDHLQGMIDGYNNFTRGDSKNFVNERLGLKDIIFMNMFYEMDDIVLPNNIYSNVTSKELFKRMVITGRVMTSVIHSYSASRKTFWSFFQWLPNPMEFRFYKYYTLNHKEGTYRYTFVGNPSQIVSTESISIMKDMDMGFSTQPILHRIERKKNSIHFIQWSHILKTSKTFSEVVDRLADIEDFEAKLVTYPLGNIIKESELAIHEIYNGHIYTTSIAKPITENELCMTTSLPTSAEWNKTSGFADEPTTPLFRESYISAYAKTTTTPYDTMYLIKNSLNYPIHEVISEFYKQNDIVLREMEDRLEVK